jgi:5-methylcytosine-specific restriction endonuclease McrA
MDTLILNADGNPLTITPLSTIPWQESIRLVFLDRVNVLEEYENWNVHSASITMKVPSVIATREYVSPNFQGVSFSRRNIFLRDDYRCQYCGDTFTGKDLTLDHVIPKSRGGGSGWDNIVASCGPCNTRKGSHTHFRPLNDPYKPNFYKLIGKRNFPITINDKSWLKYINWPKEYINIAA